MVIWWVALAIGCSGGDKPGDDSGPGSSMTDGGTTDGGTTDGGSTDGGTTGGGTTDTAPPPDPDTVPLGGPCDMEQDFGGFLVEVYEDESNIEGRVDDGVVPSSVLELVIADERCQIHRQLTPFCDPPCAAGETCTFEGECIDYPSSQDLGTVSISGLSEELALEPVTPGYTYYDTSLSHPIFQGGELITLDMPGGVYGPLTLYGVGAEPLEVLDEQWVLEDGVETVISWTPPAADVVRTEVFVSINMDQHGATPATMTCVFPDTGSGAISGELMHEMVSLGVTGFPSGAARRRTVDRAAVDGGCMDFEVAAPRTVQVDVANYTPCLVDEDCPKGQACNEKLQICEDL